MVDTKATAPRLVLAPEPHRPTPGEGASKGVGGAFSGAGTSEGALFVLPVVIPIAAAVGAATVPNDEQWAETMRKHRERNELNARQAPPYLRIAGGLDARNLFQNALVDGLESGFSEKSPCILTRSSRRACPKVAAAPRLSVQLVSQVSDTRLTVPRNPRRKTGLTFTTEAWVIVSLPAQQATRCQGAWLNWDLPQGDSSATSAGIRAMMAEQYRALGRVMAHYLYWNEGPTGYTAALQQAIGHDEFKLGLPVQRYGLNPAPPCAPPENR